MYWYNYERSKEKLTGMSPVAYRTNSSQLHNKNSNFWR
ncbi:IS3 family transposase [Virgibacillus pantothenticus]